MFGASITRHVRAATRRFVGARDGNIAVIFAIALVPVISFVGAAIDYSRANAARSSMQAALDSTALMVSKDLSSGLINTSQVAAKAQAYFTALYTNTDAKSVVVTATYTVANGSLGSTVQVTGSASVTTDFMKVAGFPNINFGTSSTAAWGNVRLRVAMALDNTGSMADNGKIQALRTAVAGSGGLIDQLTALAGQKSRRRLRLDRSVRQGRQCRLQQLQPVLDRLDRLGCSERDQRLQSYQSRQLHQLYLDAGEP
jgi:Flp pilus assembly protein TadG